MELDFRTLSRMERYKLLVSSVVPRPIALVTTISTDGIVNAAPFSYFNAVSSEPPLLVLGLEVTDYAPRKDTGDNIRNTGEFVVNLVSGAIAQEMNVCAADFPADEDELAGAGLTAAASTAVTPPRILESPVSFECKLMTALEVGTGNRVVIGEVLCMHIDDKYFDAEKFHVDTLGLELIGRMHGGGNYVRTSGAFEMPRISYEDWAAAQNAKSDT